MSETEMTKLFYKIGEACEMTGTQPYVLRFWESEFPMLRPRKNRAGQRVYQPTDIELIERIKSLLYEEEYTIAGARRQLEQERQRRRKKTPPRGGRKEAPAKAAPKAGGTTDAARLEEQVRELKEERSARAREAHLARTEADELQRRLEALESRSEDTPGGVDREALTFLRRQAISLRDDLTALASALREEGDESRDS